MKRTRSTTEFYRKTIEARSDATLKYAGKLIEEDYAEEFERISNLPESELALPEDLEKRISDLCHETALHNEKIEKIRKWKRIARMCACFFLVSAVIGTTMIMSVDAMRVRAYDFFTQNHEDYNDISLVEPGAEEGDLIPKDWENYYYPEWLPEGYVLAGTKTSGTEKMLLISNQSMEKAISFNQKPAKSQAFQVDNEYENAGVFDYNETEYLWYYKEDIYQILWKDSFNVFQIFIAEDLDTCKQILEHIAFRK